MSYIIFDVVRRYLEFRGYKVKYVQNVTDIDDKIINRANQLGFLSRTGRKVHGRYFEDMDALNIMSPHFTPVPPKKYPRLSR